ncbi:MAG: cytochrome c3 family protein [Geobacteraceae bacterium]|nr:cytochrome c3 family protein [Geobacteraceae bacterium]
MKKVLALVAATGLIAAASLASAATIVNSKHNLSPTGIGAIKGTAGTNTSQICVYCHAPHQTTGYAVLWNRNNPAATKFTLYSGVGMNSRQFASGFTTDSTSLFCMSCHDGSTSMNSVHNKGANITNVALGYAGDAGLPMITGNSVTVGGLSSNLKGTHPVNFPVTTADPTLNLGSNPTTGTKMGLADAFPLYKATAGGSVNNDGARSSTRSLECGSCHAVHDSQYSPFLRATLNGSTLCLGCHNK